MSKKMMLLALAAVSAAMFALPAVASAGSWHSEPSIAPEPFTTTTAGHGHTKLVTANREVTCDGAGGASSTGSGTTNVGGTTGTIQLRFIHCVASGTTCTTAGQSSGNITTSAGLVFHNILIHANTPGVKITGVGGTTQLAHFTCGFGLVTINVTGTVIGHVEQPCGFKGKTISVDFNAPGGTQEFKHETTTGTTTDLTSTANGSPETGAQDGTGTITTANEKEIKCT